MPDQPPPPPPPDRPQETKPPADHHQPQDPHPSKKDSLVFGDGKAPGGHIEAAKEFVAKHTEAIAEGIGRYAEAVKECASQHAQGIAQGVVGFGMLMTAGQVGDKAVQALHVTDTRAPTEFVAHASCDASNKPSHEVQVAPTQTEHVAAADVSTGDTSGSGVRPSLDDVDQPSAEDDADAIKSAAETLVKDLKDD